MDLSNLFPGNKQLKKAAQFGDKKPQPTMPEQSAGLDMAKLAEQNKLSKITTPSIPDASKTPITADEKRKKALGQK